MKPNFVGRLIVNFSGFNDYDTDEKSQQLFQSLKQTNTDILKQRFINITKIDTPIRKFSIASVYIRPVNDYLVVKETN
ncbi:hypothetical protein Misp06_00628 [Microbulbifer sp. NBRC 101763]